MSIKKTICVDFDGVIHWYRDGWQDGVIYDEPVPGAIRWLVNMTETDDIKICIYSSRSKDPILLAAMKDWLWKQIDRCLDRKMALSLMLSDNGEDTNKLNKSQEIMSKISFPTQKPPAWLTIDDRAICFKGTFPTYEEINNFQPWNTNGIKE